MTLVIVGAFAFIWISVASLTILNPLNFILWNALMTVIVAAVAYNSIYLLQPDTMIIRAYIQNVFSVASSYPQSKYQGFLGSGFVPVFPPGWAHAYTLPLTLITIPFPRVEAVTNDDRSDPKNPIPSLPVIVSLYISFRPNPELEAMRRFVRVIPIIEPFSKDFTVEHNVDFFGGTDPDTGKIKYIPKLCPCITTILQDKIGPAIGEAVSRAVGELTLPDIIRDRKKLEDKIKQQFGGTVLTESGIMIVENGELKEGEAALFLDFNIDAVTLANPDALRSMSAEQTALYNSRAKIAEATGDAEYLRQVSEQAATPAGRAALASQTIKNLPAGTKLFAGVNLLSATAAALLDQEPPKPKEQGDMNGSE